MSQAQWEQAPVVDYDSHPAFAALAAGGGADGEGDALAAEIDAAYGALDQGGQTPEARLARFDREVAPRLERLKAHICRRARPQFAEFAGKAMAVAHRFLRDDLNARDPGAATRNDTRAVTGIFADELPRLRREGCFEFLDAGLAQRVWAATRIERFLLRRQRKKNPCQHCVLALHPSSPGFRLIRRMAEESGMVDFVSAYTGKPMEFHYAALDHAHPGQTWYQGCYADLGLPTAKTVYMHTDADFDIVKSMFYLKDVGPGDGPFRFVPGSHNWRRSPLTVAVQKGFDEASREIFATETRNRGYYRPRFMLPDQRRDMLAMPRCLRGSTHFGDDVVDASPLSDALLEAERSFVSPAGTVVIFDGSRGIHRGGQVEPGGSRWAVQIAFQVRPQAREALSLPQRIKRRAGYFKQLAIKLVAAAGGG